MHGFCDDRDGDVEKEQAKGDGEPEEEGDYPAQVLSVEDETCNPPAVASVSVSQSGIKHCTLKERPFSREDDV